MTIKSFIAMIKVCMADGSINMQPLSNGFNLMGLLKKHMIIIEITTFSRKMCLYHLENVAFTAKRWTLFYKKSFSVPMCGFLSEKATFQK